MFSIEERSGAGTLMIGWSRDHNVSRVTVNQSPDFRVRLQQRLVLQHERRLKVAKRLKHLLTGSQAEDDCSGAARRSYYSLAVTVTVAVVP